jgi:chaperonin cofactor prefoldin
MQTSGTKRAKLTNTNLKLLAKETDQHLETMYQEQYRVFDELSSIAESYTVYKEGFVLCKSALFMKLLKEHT